MAVTLATIEDFVRLDHGLAVVSVVRPDATPVGSLVNAGVLDHPTTGERVVGLVVQGKAHKVAHLRARPFAAVTWRHSWNWVSAAGPVELIGPEDSSSGLGPDAVRLLLRAVFIGASGTHDDWDAFDRVMADEARLAILLRPDRLTGNPNI